MAADSSAHSSPIAPLRRPKVARALASEAARVDHLALAASPAPNAQNSWAAARSAGG